MFAVEFEGLREVFEFAFGGFFGAQSDGNVGFCGCRIVKRLFGIPNETGVGRKFFGFDDVGFGDAVVGFRDDSVGEVFDFGTREGRRNVCFDGFGDFGSERLRIGTLCSDFKRFFGREGMCGGETNRKNCQRFLHKNSLLRYIGQRSPHMVQTCSSCGIEERR